MTQKACKKCGKHIPANVWIDGKKRNLQKRRYCFDCSPFGRHNTSQLEKIPDRLNQKCVDCGKKYKRNGIRCPLCYFQKRKKEVIQRIDDIVGLECWLCGYNKTRRNLCFHHMNEQTKLFQLTTRETMLKWERVLAEMKKCILVCANCHGEIHEGIIVERRVLKVWKQRW